MGFRHRFSHLSGEWASRLKSVCYICIALAIILLLVGVLAPGGMNGTVGPICVVLSFLILLIGLLLGVAGILLAGSAMAASVGVPPVKSPPGVKRISTSRVIHEDIWGSMGMLREAGRALEVRGATVREMFPDEPEDFLASFEKFRHVRPFTEDERIALWPTLCLAINGSSMEGSTVLFARRAAEMLGVQIPSVWVHPDVPARHLHSDYVRDHPEQTRFTALDASWEFAATGFEKGVKWVFVALSVMVFVVKVIMLFFRTPGGSGAPRTNSGTILAAIAIFGAVFFSFLFLKSALAWRRKRMHRWALTTTPRGIRAEPPAHLAAEPIEVDADACLVWIDAGRETSLAGNALLRWHFAFDGVGQHLTCMEFDPRGTPWQEWLDDFAAAVQAEQDDLSESTDQATTVP